MATHGVGMVSNGGDDNLSGTWHAWSMLRHSWACVRTWITFLELAHMVDATPLMGLGWGAVGGVTTPLERAHWSMLHKSWDWDGVRWRGLHLHTCRCHCRILSTAFGSLF